MSLALCNAVTGSADSSPSTGQSTTAPACESMMMLLLRQRPLLLLGWALFFLGIPLTSTIVSVLLLLVDSLVVFIRARLLGHEVAGPPIRSRQEGGKAKHLRILFILLGFWAMVGSLASIRPDIAVPSTIGLALIIITFFFRASDLLWEDCWILRRTIPFLVIGLLIASGYGIYAARVKRVVRLELLAQGPNVTGTCLLIAILLAWSYADWLQRPWQKVGVRLAALAAVPRLLFTGSRGAWLGFAGGVASYMLFSSNRRNIVWAVVAVLIVAMVVQTSPSVQRRIDRMFSLERNRDRLEVWSVTLSMIPDHLVFGIGTAVFPHVYQQYSPRGNSMALAHNFFLHALAEYGVPGLVLLVTVVGLSIVAGFQVVAKHRWALAQGVLAALIGTLIHQQVDNTIHAANLANIFWFLCGFLVALRQGQGETPTELPCVDRAQAEC